MANRLHRIALYGIVFALTACGGAAGTVPSRLPLSQSVAASAPSVYVAESCESSSTSCPDAKGLVRQLDGSTITAGIANPVAVAIGKSGNVFVSNAITVDDGNITVYAPGSGRVSRTIVGFKGVSYALAFSPSNELFVVSHYKYQCCQIKGSVEVYAPGGTHPIRHLSGVGAFPGKPVFDESGNLYVPNFYNFPGFITEYAPGATSPFRAFKDGIGFPLALLIGGHGQLYVLNGVFGGGTDVLEYAHGRASLTRTIAAGISNASAIALDPRGRLYVANRGEKNVSPSVTVYAPGSSSPELTIRKGIRDPVALAFDAGGNLYVANAPVGGTNTVTVYAANTGTPEKTYRLGEAPTALTSDILHARQLTSKL